MEVGKHEEATEATGVVNANKNCKNKSNIELREIVVQDGILGTSLVSFCIMRFATSPLPSESEARRSIGKEYRNCTSLVAGLWPG